ncbi:MAG: nucleotidyltransferase family protein [Planctomycetota bacterium]
MMAMHPGLDVLAQNCALAHAVRPVLKSLAAQDIVPIALKGFALLATQPQRVATRPMCDVDLLVRCSEVESAIRIIENCGFQRVRSGGLDFMRRQGGLCFRIDLQHEIWYLSSDELDAWRARATWLPEASVSIPAPEDHLLYVAVHAVVQHGALRAQWCEDLSALAAQAIRWDLVVAAARRAGLALPLLLALERAVSEVPPSAHAALEAASRPDWRRRLLEAVLARPENPGIGHLLKLAFARRGRGRLLRQQLLPSRALRRQLLGNCKGYGLLRPWRLARSASATVWRFTTARKATRT